MKKRSKFDTNFDNVPNDFFRTFDVKAHIPLNNRLDPNTKFAEPCAGYGDLIEGLENLGHECVFASELVDRPECPYDFVIKDALNLTKEDIKDVDCICTNPPWTRKILHPLIEHFISLEKPVWLIFEADWMHTKQAIPYLEYCTEIVSVGRVKWIPGSKYGGLKDCCWYRFVKNKKTPTQFIGQ